jgi:hypothetical protein
VVVPGSTRNRVGGDESPRGFESHPLRQIPRFAGVRARDAAAGRSVWSAPGARAVRRGREPDAERRRGEVPERPKGHDWKSCTRSKGVSRVQIPPSPPFASRRGRARRGGSGTLYPQSALAGSNSRPEVRPCWTEPGGAALKAGPHATGICQPPQARKGARVRRPSRVPWDPLAGAVSVRRSQDGWYRRRVHGHFLLVGGGQGPPPTALAAKLRPSPFGDATGPASPQDGT